LRKACRDYLVLLLLLPPVVRSHTFVLTSDDRQTDKQETSSSQPCATCQSSNGQSGSEKPKTPVPNPVQEEPKTDNPKQSSDDSEGKQSKRMFWVVPNFAAVDAHAQLPPLSTREKFKIATQDSFDYSAFVWTGILAGQNMAVNSYPELHDGIAGYGRYYWRAFADQASGSYFTEAIVPAITHEDPRYYTRGYGGFSRRAGYALSQVVLTKTDSGKITFNISEIAGSAMVAGVSNLYYPRQERGVGSTAKNWGMQIEAAALNNVVREFWPDIRRKVFKQK
jgi:hypothetical protein